MGNTHGRTGTIYSLNMYLPLFRARHFSRPETQQETKPPAHVEFSPEVLKGNWIQQNTLLPHSHRGGSGKAAVAYVWSREGGRAWDELLENLAFNPGSALCSEEQVPSPLGPLRSSSYQRAALNKTMSRAPKFSWGRTHWVNGRISVNDSSIPCGQQRQFSKGAARKWSIKPSPAQGISTKFKTRPHLIKRKTLTPSVNMNRNVKVDLGPKPNESNSNSEYDFLNFAGVCEKKVAIKGQEGLSATLY